MKNFVMIPAPKKEVSEKDYQSLLKSYSHLRETRKLNQDANQLNDDIKRVRQILSLVFELKSSRQKTKRRKNA